MSADPISAVAICAVEVERVLADCVRQSSAALYFNYP